MENHIDEYLTNVSIWASIEQDSMQIQKSMDQLHRKQTGSYYTATNLTISMMKDFVNGLDDETKSEIHSKKFLEPCVGTGNFVFAYLFACKELQLSKDKYEQLLDNIYVCDINAEALEKYKQNLRMLAQNWFGITLSNEYFNTHIGSSLLFDVEQTNIKYIPISDAFPSLANQQFDFVVTNPPYKNLKAEKSHYVDDEEYSKDQEKYATIKELSKRFFSYSTTGTLNLYKLFVEEIIERYLSPNGYASLLIPASILSDKTCSKLRTHILTSCSLKSIQMIPEDSAYVNASQALCAIRFQKGVPTNKVYIEGALSKENRKGALVNLEDILDEETGNSILVLSNEEYQKRNKMREFPLIKDIPYIHNLRGELDISFNKSSVISEPSPYKFYRGRNIGYYELVELSEGEYSDEQFVEKTAKKQFVHRERIACQQIVNMSKKRRISFAPVPSNSVLGNSCNFIAVDKNDENIDIYFILGILNSTYIDWYFKLTSSNNHINNYEIDHFPIPIYYNKKSDISQMVQEYLHSKDEKLLKKIDDMVGIAYGLQKNAECIKERDTMFSNNKLIEERFFTDLSFLIPNITKSEIVDLLNGTLSDTEMLTKGNFANNKIEGKAAISVIDKYKKMYSGKVLNHTTFKLSDLDLEMIESVPQGGSWKDIPIETVKKSKRLEKISKSGGRTTLYGRIDYSKPSYTITTYFNRPGNGTYVHPVHERVISVREAARFQCFPDSYYFCGNKTDKLKQVGNAVPVLLAYNIGKSIKDKTGCTTSVDLFSGAGGMTYGFKQAGINAVIANDLFENACITLKTNSPEIPVLCGDITQPETKAKIISAGLNGNADIICGGPPCQGFSLAGFRMKDDPRNELFRHFIDIVSGVNPKVIVFENVEGILSYQGGETYREILSLFSELGYYAEGRKLSANDYGVPQRRKRVIILCTRKDIGVLPSDIFPKAITPNLESQVSAYDTIYDLEQVECDEEAKYNSSYSSNIIRYLKGEISADEYTRLVSDIQNCSISIYSPEKLNIKKAAIFCEQLSLF